MRAPFLFLAYAFAFRRLLFAKLFGGRLEKCPQCVGSLHKKSISSIAAYTLYALAALAWPCVHENMPLRMRILHNGLYVAA